MTQHLWELIGATSLAITTTVIGPTIFEHIKLKFFTTKKEIDMVRYDTEKNMIITEEIVTIREFLDADRIWVEQFHNGGHFLQSNKSIQKFSITYEDTKPGVSSVLTLFKDVPLSLYSKSMNEIMKHGHIYIPDYSDNSIETFGLSSAANATGTMSSYSVGLFDISTDKCMGILGVDYREKKRLNNDQKDYLIDKSNRLSGYLSVFLKSK